MPQLVEPPHRLDAEPCLQPPPSHADGLLVQRVPVPVCHEPRCGALPSQATARIAPSIGATGTALFQPNAGAIAYAGETVEQPDNLGIDLLSRVAAAESSGARLLGDAWRAGQVWYWKHEDPTNTSAPRISSES